MIESPLTAAERRQIQALQKRRGREETGLFLAEGARVVEELLASGVDLVMAVMVSTMEDSPRGAALAAELSRRTLIRRVSDKELKRLATTDTPQGVVVVARIPEATLESFTPREREVVLVLDAVQDPGNFGTLVRSAEAFGAGLVVALPGTVDAWNPKAVRSAAGSSFRLPMVSVELPELSHWLRRESFRLYAADVEGVPVESVDRTGRVALVVGNEGAGLTAATMAAADARVTVPIKGRTESLNVGVAAGILLYLLSRGE
jgi:RNA methyltransferase, TrmH family